MRSSGAGSKDRHACTKCKSGKKWLTLISLLRLSLLRNEILIEGRTYLDSGFVQYRWNLRSEAADVGVKKEAYKQPLSTFLVDDGGPRERTMEYKTQPLKAVELRQLYNVGANDVGCLGWTSPTKSGQVRRWRKEPHWKEKPQWQRRKRWCTQKPFLSFLFSHFSKLKELTCRSLCCSIG